MTVSPHGHQPVGRHAVLRAAVGHKPAMPFLEAGAQLLVALGLDPAQALARAGFLTSVQREAPCS